MNKRRIILASASPWRRKILKATGISFRVVESGYRENMTLKLPPTALAKKLALGKAVAVAKRHKDALIIGADTFIVFKGRIIGKPKSKAEAVAILRGFSGTTHVLLTGFVVIDSKTGRNVSKVVKTRVKFRKLSQKEIIEYVKTGEPMCAAGGYAIQDGGGKLIESISGDFDNVAGLPVKALLMELRKFRVPFRTRAPHRGRSSVI
jgi:septum formation protein